MLETICQTLLEGYKRNWATSRDANVSIRHHGRPHFYITPSGVRKQTLQPDQFKKILVGRDMFADEEHEYTWRTIPHTDISAMLSPSGEIPLHFNLQKKISDNNVRVVTHLHPTYTVAAMHAGIELSELVNSFPELRRYTSVARNVGEVPPISEELGRACCDSLGLDSAGNLKYNIVGIKGHGVVSVDSSPWGAFEHIERLEHICKIVLVSKHHRSSQECLF